MLRSLQGYLRDTFGAVSWDAIVRASGLGVSHFEAMLPYDLTHADRLAAAASTVLRRPTEALWEDMGTYLVTNQAYEGMRRLLRFGGTGFVDFLHSLEDLPDRARLALPDLTVPDLAVEEVQAAHFRLTYRFHVAGTGPVLLGILRAMADDYGTLALIDLEHSGEGGGVISIQVLKMHHAKARPFVLVRPVM